MKTKKILTIIILIVTACFRLEAATFTVTTVNDTGSGSLRQAIVDANALAGADTIGFSTSVFATPQTITLSSQLLITTDLTINGPGANLLSIIGTQGAFWDSSMAMNDVLISGMEIEACYNQSANVFYIAQAHLTIRNCEIHDNTAYTIFTMLQTNFFSSPTDPSLTIENSSFSHNNIVVSLNQNVHLTVSNSTFFLNSNRVIDGHGFTDVTLTNVTMANTTGDKVISLPDYSNFSIRNCIFDNSIPNFFGSIYGSFTYVSLGHNISNDNSMASFMTAAGDMNNTSARLDPAGLQNNGGTTRTVALLCNSPALDATTNYFSTDQVGHARGAVADIGAYESSIPHFLPTVIGPDTLCSGSSATLTASSGEVWMWSTSQGGYQISVNPTTTTTYTVTVYNNGGQCSNTASKTVTVIPAPVVSITPANPSVCPGGSTTLTASGGQSYSWFNGGTTASITVNPPVTTIYGVVVTGANGCTSSASITVTVSAPAANITPANPVICGVGSATLTASGGTSYLWSTSQTTASITVNPSSTTAYTVTVTGSNGCTASVSKTVTVNPLPVSNISTPNASICNGGSTTLDAGNWSSYLWSTGQSTRTITVSGGTYTVTVTNSGGCTATASQTITVFQTPAPTISGATTFCSGNSTTLDAGSWSSYLWSTGASSQTIPVNTGGTYTVTVTNQDGCIGTNSRTVTVFPTPTPAIIGANTLCAGNSTTLDAGSWSSYLWSTGSTLQTISVNTGGTYTVTVTNANGCAGSASHSVTVFPLPSPTIGGTNISCAGSSTTLNAGSWESYLWSTGATTQTISVNTAGTYTVTVSNNGCTGSATRIITAPPALSVNAGADEATYFGFSADQTLSHTAVATGGTTPFTYSWTMSRALKCNQVNTTGDEIFSSGTCTFNSCPASPLNTTLSSPPVCSGSAMVTVKLIEDAVITVTVTDANGCTATSSFNVTSEDARCFSGNSGVQKVVICHHYGNNGWAQLCVNEDAVADHLAHGDFVGSCNGHRMDNSVSGNTTLNAYPNPASDAMNISFYSEKSETYTLRVVNAAGQVVLSEQKQAAAGGNNYALDLKNFARGIYTVLLQSGDELMQTRIVKE